MTAPGQRRHVCPQGHGVPPPSYSQSFESETTTVRSRWSWCFGKPPPPPTPWYIFTTGSRGLKARCEVREASADLEPPPAIPAAQKKKRGAGAIAAGTPHVARVMSPGTFHALVRAPNDRAAALHSSNLIYSSSRPPPLPAPPSSDRRDSIRAIRCAASAGSCSCTFGNECPCAGMTYVDGHGE